MLFLGLLGASSVDERQLCHSLVVSGRQQLQEVSVTREEVERNTVL